MLEKGDKIRLPNNKQAIVDWCHNGKVGAGGEVYLEAEVKLLQRQLFTVRVTKPIHEMTEEELLDMTRAQNTARQTALTNNADKPKRGKKPASGDKPPRKSTKRATAKPLDKHFEELAKIVGEEKARELRERIQNGGNKPNANTTGTSV